MPHHIKAFPPAVKDFPADRMIFAARSAIDKRNKPTQSGASSLKLIDIFIHCLTGFAYLYNSFYFNFLFFKGDSYTVENSIDKSAGFFGAELLPNVNCFVDRYF